MKHPESHNHEWFQVQATFGNFDTREEAERFKNKLSVNEGPEYIQAEIKGSWH